MSRHLDDGVVANQMRTLFSTISDTQFASRFLRVSGTKAYRSSYRPRPRPYSGGRRKGHDSREKDAADPK